jgi:hypothetical protein
MRLRLVDARQGDAEHSPLHEPRRVCRLIRMPSQAARKVVDTALALRQSHGHVPALEVLDLAMLGHLDPLDFEDEGDPPHPFALLVAEAFDDIVTPREWFVLLGPDGEPELREGMRQVWRMYVWSRFVARYAVHVAA